MRERLKFFPSFIGLALTLLVIAPPVQAQPAYEVKDIAPGSASSPLSDFGVLGGRLYFAASDPVHGVELWKSDGTPAGTAMLTDIWVGSGNGNPHYFTRVGDTLFFTRIYNTLMKTDGTAAGTVEVKPFAYCRSLTNVGGTLFFAGDDGFGSGDELWKSDGTEAGTVMVKDIDPVPGNNGLAVNPTMIAVGSKAFFVANDGTHGNELWKSDGTDAGTVMVKDIQPGASNGVEILATMTGVNGLLFFVANDGVNGNELWKSDGTTAGTVMVRDISIFGSSNPYWLTNVGGTLYFAAAEDDGATFYGNELMRSDGTLAGTFRVKDIVPGVFSGNPNSLTNFNGTLLFSANGTSQGFELWKSDGTDAGTALVKDINAGAGDGFPQEAFVAQTIVVGNRMFLRANDGTSGLELWRTDGTTAGTVRVQDVRPGASGSNLVQMTRAGSLVYFAADDGTTGVEPWAINVNNDRTIDFFGDRKTDLTVFNPPTGLWYRRNSANSSVTAVGYGGSGYQPVPGDYDGDGNTDLAVYDPASGLWYVRASSTGTDTVTGFGGPGYAPVRGDFDGDGKTDLGLYQDSTGTWRIRLSGSGTTLVVPYGASGYTTVPGDYDGDAKTDIAVYHAPSGLWFIRNSSTGTDTATGFGGTGYAPVRGDFDGDGKNDLAVFHGASGLWFIKQSSTVAVVTIGFGASDYVTVPENYDGDGMTDLAVYHPPSGLWYLRSSLNGGTTTATGFGGPGYNPVN